MERSDFEIKEDVLLNNGEFLLRFVDNPNHFVIDEKLFNVISAIVGELNNAKEKHPEYPENYCERFCIIAEEVGELAQAINDSKNGGPHAHKIRDEAIQVGAMAIRFLLNLNDGDDIGI